MNIKVKQLWVDALRSGKYQQGYGYLHTRTKNGDDYYCCLGVLCEVAISEGILLPKRIEETRFGTISYDYATMSLPKVVYEWADLYAETESTLIELNDGERKTFNEIADYIEKEAEA